MLGACGALALTVSAVQAQEAKSASNRPIEFYNPEGLPRWVYSYAVSTEGWVKTASVSQIKPTDRSGDIKAQTASALVALDKILAEHGADRGALLKVNTTFVGTSLKQTQEISDVLKAYFDAKAATSNGAIVAADYPVRTAVGQHTLDEANLKVVLDVQFVDMKNTPANLIADAKARAQADTHRELIFGGVTAQQKDFTIEGYPDPALEAKGTIKNLQKILAEANMTLKNVKSLKVYYVDPEQTAMAFSSVQLASTDSTFAPELKASDSKVRASVESAIKSSLAEAGVSQLPTVTYEAAAVDCVVQNAVLVEGVAN
ncbi:RidA family protein [Nitrospirillum amazonense]|uniref:RidA family protein n=1 Tax=Nitrospirillum amazonense TaxID=28077 RepID=UPI00164622CE|nr:RidA family protein [Nitrospirillum amazonense]